MIIFPDLPEKFVFSAAVSKAATVEPGRIQKDISTLCVWMFRQGESIYEQTNQSLLLSFDRGLFGVSFTG